MILMYNTAARIEEMLRIKLCDFRYGKTPTATLHSKHDKICTVPIMERTIQHLRQYLGVFHPKSHGDENRLFYSDIHLETTLIYAHADIEHKRRAIEVATSNGCDYK